MLKSLSRFIGFIFIYSVIDMHFLNTDGEDDEVKIERLMDMN